MRLPGTHDLLQQAAEPERVENRGVDVAARDRVTDPEELKATAGRAPAATVLRAAPPDRRSRGSQNAAAGPERARPPDASRARPPPDPRHGSPPRPSARCGTWRVAGCRRARCARDAGRASARCRSRRSAAATQPARSRPSPSRGDRRARRTRPRSRRDASPPPPSARRGVRYRRRRWPARPVSPCRRARPTRSCSARRRRSSRGPGCRRSRR